MRTQHASLGVALALILACGVRPAAAAPAGAPVQIGFMLEAFRDAGGNNGAHGVGTILFDSLPAGVSVTSCKGYASGTTSTRATSWGTLKLHYR